MISTTTLSLVTGLLALWFWAPSLAETVTLRPGWIITIWLSFLIPHTALAGGLHLWLYRAKGQGTRLKYDQRGQTKDNGSFTFRSQLKDNMFWSLASGISFATLYTSLWFWAAGNGWAARRVSNWSLMWRTCRGFASQPTSADCSSARSTTLPATVLPMQRTPPTTRCRS